MSLILLGILNSQVTAAGGGPAYDLIQTVTPTGSSVQFTGLGSLTDYKHLQVRIVARQGGGVNAGGLTLQMNGVTSSSYAHHKLYSYLAGGGIQSNASSSTSSITITSVIGSNQPAGVFSTAVVDILDFSNANKNTTVRVFDYWAYADNANGDVSLRSGLFNNTAAVTSLTFGPIFSSFETGTRFSLYGVK